jgi:hypothetical protein
MEASGWRWKGALEQSKVRAGKLTQRGASGSRAAGKPQSAAAGREYRTLTPSCASTQRWSPVPPAEMAQKKAEVTASNAAIRKSEVPRPLGDGVVVLKRSSSVGQWLRGRPDRPDVVWLDPVFVAPR